MAEKQRSIVRSIARFFLTYASGPLFGLFAFIFVNRGFEIKGETTVALIWTLIAYVAAQHVISAIDAEKGGGSIREQIAEVRQDITAVRQDISDTAQSFRTFVLESLKVTRIPAAEFNDRLRYSLRNTMHVKNTYVGLSPLNGLGSRKHAQICEYYRTVLTRSEDATWEDIVGVSDFFEGRFEDLDQNCEWGVLGSHTIHVLDTRVPILNFMLLGDDEQKFSEVVFGWIPNSTSETPMFQCSDPKIVAMFENYFEALKRVDRLWSLPVISYKLEPRRRYGSALIQRLKGDWLSVSGAVTQLPGGKDGLNANKGVLQSYAAISIKYEKGWKIEGRVHAAGSGEPIYLFSSVTCMLVNNSLYYRYVNSNLYGRREASGVGVYSIAIDQDEMRGYYVKETAQLLDGARGEGTAKASSLRAIKVDNLDEVDNSDRLKLIDERILRSVRPTKARVPSHSSADGDSGAATFAPLPVSPDLDPHSPPEENA